MTTEYVFKTQLELILAALMPDNRRVLQVMLRTGLRVSDALSLRREQVRRQFWVTESKTGKRKQCGLPDWLIEDILKNSEGSVWAFPSPKDSAKHRTRQAVWKDIKNASRAFRIPVNVGTHTMRKVYAVDLMQKYGSLDIVKKALNHDNAMVTVIYAMADELTRTAPLRRSVQNRTRRKRGG